MLALYSMFSETYYAQNYAGGHNRPGPLHSCSMTAHAYLLNKVDKFLLAHVDQAYARITKIASYIAS